MWQADLHVSSLALFLTSLQCFLLCVCFTCPILHLQYVTFFLQVLNSSFFHGGRHAFASIAYVHTSFLIPPHFRANSTFRQQYLFEPSEFATTPPSSLSPLSLSIAPSASRCLILGRCQDWWWHIYIYIYIYIYGLDTRTAFDGSGTGVGQVGLICSQGVPAQAFWGP